MSKIYYTPLEPGEIITEDCVNFSPQGCVRMEELHTGKVFREGMSAIFRPITPRPDEALRAALETLADNYSRLATCEPDSTEHPRLGLVCSIYESVTKELRRALGGTGKHLCYSCRQELDRARLAPHLSETFINSGGITASLADGVDPGVALSPSVHVLKCWPQFYSAILDGTKTFEYRKNDRNFQLGDVLNLREWDRCDYTGRSTSRKVCYILHGPDFGIPAGYCVMGLEQPPVADERAEFEAWAKRQPHLCVAALEITGAGEWRGWQARAALSQQGVGVHGEISTDPDPYMRGFTNDGARWYAKLEHERKAGQPPQSAWVALVEKKPTEADGLCVFRFDNETILAFGQCWSPSVKYWMTLPPPPVAGESTSPPA